MTADASDAAGGLPVDEVCRAVAAEVDADRLWDRHMRMAEIGAIPDDGVCRQALTAEDVEARALLLSWTEPAGRATAVDDMANLFVRRPGTDPAALPVVTGSHMDSQPMGGRFDGISGVLAALAVQDALDAAGVETARPVELVAWTNEEGGRFAPGAMGSAVFAGRRSLESVIDGIGADGVRLGDALRTVLAATPDAERRPFGWDMDSYLELHIEQGPLLERAGLAAGVVTGIQGIRWFRVAVSGAGAHAGTAPLSLRRDALQAAVRAIQALNALMHDPDDVLRFTVGRMEVTPNSPNTVADRVVFTIDLRHPAPAVLAEKGDAVAAAVAAAADPCTVEVSETFAMPPAAFPALAAETVANAAEALGIGSMRLASGAFHDAMFLADRCPTGMLFVPCRDGVSHHPSEYASKEDLAAGTRVLAAAVTALARR